MTQIFLGAGCVETTDGTLGGTLSGRLSGRERALFQCLVDRRGQVVTTSELERAVWGEDRGDARRVKVLVRRLRSKLEPIPAEPAYILTVHRQGYRLAQDEVEAVAPAAPSPGPGPPVLAPHPDVARDTPVVPTLFGRGTEQAQLEEWLLRRRGPWLTLTGVGGVGKSALLAWAHARARTAGLACWRVALREVETLDGALTRIASAGQIQLPPHLEPAPVLASALRGRPGLWVLDDLSSLDPQDRMGLDRLFSPLTQVRVLASSRQPMRSLDEAVLPLSPLEAKAAAAMFRSLQRDSSAPVPERLPLLPLWIKLAVASDGAAVQESSTGTALIEAAIARAPATAALGRLGWHPGETVQDFLCFLLDVSKSDVSAWGRHGLIELVDEDRVRVHPVIRSALRARSVRSDPMGKGSRQQLERLVTYVTGQAARDFAQEPRAIRRQLVDYLDLLHGWFASLRPDRIDAALVALPTLIQVVLGSGRERAWLETANRLADRLDRREEHRAAARLRLLTADISDKISPAAQHLQQLEGIAREHLDAADQDLLDLLGALGQLLVGDAGAAEELLARFDGRSADLAAPLQVRYRLARASYLRRVGRYAEAVVEARAAVVDVRSVAPMLEPNAWIGLIAALQENGSFDEAGPALDQGERAAIHWDDHAALATVLRQRAQQASMTRNTAGALAYAERALSLSYPGSSIHVYALYTAAILNRSDGRGARSLDLLDQALTEATEQRLPTLAPLILDSQGNTLLLQGDTAQALARYVRALDAIEALGDDREARRIHSNIAYAHLIAGDLASALRHQELGAKIDDMPLAWKAYWAWRQAAILAAGGDLEQAAPWLALSADQAAAMPSVELLCEAAALAALWLYEAGEPARAVEICEGIELGRDASPLLRRLPSDLREAVERPATPDVSTALGFVKAALRDPALERSGRESELRTR